MEIPRRNRRRRRALANETPSPGLGAAAGGGKSADRGMIPHSSRDRAEGVGAPRNTEAVSTPDSRSLVMYRRRGVGGMYVYAECPAGHHFRWRHFAGHTTSGAGAWLAEHIECAEELRGGPSVFSAFSDAFESPLTVDIDGRRISGALARMRSRS